MIDAAIIGLGRWGKGIVQSVQAKSAGLRFIRGVSKEPDDVQDFAAAPGFALSSEFADVVADPRIQAVVLATPHSLHVDQIVAAAAAGRPGVVRGAARAERSRKPSARSRPAARPEPCSRSATTSAAFRR